MELLCNNCQKRINGWKLETWEIKKQKVKDEAVYCEHTWNADHTLNTVTNHFDKDKQILPKENTFSYAYSYGCSKCNFISRGNNYRDNYLDDKHEFDKKKNLIHKEEREREREREFWCGICNIKFPADFLGGETIYEGKVCRSCLGKRQRGEATNPPENQPKTKYNESFEPKDRYKSSLRDSSEMRILLRELSRKQSKKSRHLTSFIINLAILQWLLPLITYLAFWIQLKENIKVQALNNPGMGLTTEIPFSTVIKDFFKILTSETYVYGGHNFQISILWKIGIVLVFLIPLGIWIYNLIGFFSAKGEVERLETEIKAIER